MRRRRRNPDTGTVLNLALLGAGAYVFYVYVWPLISKAAGAVKSGAQAVANPLANTYLALTAPSGPALANAMVVLDSGAEVPVSSLQNVRPTTLPDGTASATFTYQGVKYQFTGPSDETGTYYALAVGS